VIAWCVCVQLAAEFQVRFEAPHVINARTQVWAGSIAAGPDKHSIVANFEQSKKPAFQDSLGKSIAAIAGVVPDGLLVFFSSYSMMDRLKERWEVNDTLSDSFSGAMLERQMCHSSQYQV